MHLRVLLRPTRARTEPERGAVAVLVAVLASAVLFTVGALAVDIGSAWAERFGLQTVAESAALAGAAVLPMTPDLLSEPAADAAEDAAVAAAARTVCADGNRRPGWDTVCGTGWATDGNPDNGEIDVVDSEQDYPTEFTEARLEAAPRVLRVRTPPVRVEFGLARAAGFDNIDVAASASARRGLPYPADRRLPVAPFYLTLEDLEDPDYEGICLRTTDRPTTTSWPPAPDATPTSVTDPSPLFRIGVVDDTDPDAPSPSDSIIGTQTPVTRVLRQTIMAGLTDTVPLTSLTVYVGDDDAAHTATTQAIAYLPGGPGPADDRFDITFRTPDLSSDPAYNGPVPVWFVYTDPSGNQVVSNTTSLTYPSPPGRPFLDCDPSDAGRGLVDLSRDDPAETPVRQWDVAQGLTSEVHVFGSWPVAQETPGTDDDCYDPSVSGEVRPGSEPPPGEWVPEVNCLRLSPGTKAREVDLTNGWLATSGSTPQGRLRTLCTGDTGTISGVPDTLDATNLFRSSNGLMAPGVSSWELRDRVRNGYAANARFRGALLEKVFDCPRLLLVPVLDTSNPPAGTRAGAGTYPVVGLTYFYVYDVGRWGVERASRGLIRQSDGRVVGVRGWAIDPAYVRGGDWIDHLEDPDDALPYAVPKRAVLVRAPGDDHPDTGT